MFTIARVLGAIYISYCQRAFVKSWRNTHRTHSKYNWSEYWLAFCLICKFHWFWKCENFSLLAEAKCHVVWKMIVLSSSPRTRDILTYCRAFSSGAVMYICMCLLNKYFQFLLNLDRCQIVSWVYTLCILLLTTCACAYWHQCLS